MKIHKNLSSTRIPCNRKDGQTVIVQEPLWFPSPASTKVEATMMTHRIFRHLPINPRAHFVQPHGDFPKTELGFSPIHPMQAILRPVRFRKITSIIRKTGYNRIHSLSPDEFCQKTIRIPRDVPHTDKDDLQTVPQGFHGDFFKIESNRG